MFQEVFVLGGLAFWALLIVWFCITVWMTEWERWGLALLSLVLLIAALTLFSDFNLFKFIWTHPIESAIAVVAYFIPIGLLVGIGKWWLYCLEAREKNREAKAKWLTEKVTGSAYGSLTNYKSKINAAGGGGTYFGIDQAEFESRVAGLEEAVATGKMTEGAWPVWLEYERNFYWTDWLGHNRGITKPDAGDNKWRIINWIAYWPAVAFWFILHDPITRLSKFIYYRVAGLLTQISDAVWKNEQDFPIKEKK